MALGADTTGNIINALPQQFIANHKASLNNVTATQHAMLAGMQKLVDLNLKVFKASFDEINQKTQEAIKIQDAQEALNFSSSLLQPGAEKVLAYTKQVYDVVAGIQSDVTKLTEAQVEQA